MNEPRRLSQSGGVSQRLLDSASIDKPSAAARRRAALMAATASSFSSTSSGVSAAAVRPANVAKTLATWIFVGAAASATLALFGSTLLDASHESAASHHAAAPVLAELPAAPSIAPARSPDIAAEPHLVAKMPTIAATPPSPSAASVAEARELEAARAAIKRGDNAGAIAVLDGYDKAHPSGALKADALALRIQALKNSGKSAEVRALPH